MVETPEDKESANSMSKAAASPRSRPTHDGVIPKMPVTTHLSRVTSSVSPYISHLTPPACRCAAGREGNAVEVDSPLGGEFVQWARKSAHVVE
jgi:hypothetical protein